MTVSELAENTNSIFCEGSYGPRQQMMSGSAEAGTTAESHRCELEILTETCALSRARLATCVFP